MRIVTRGYDSGQMVVTQGYGGETEAPEYIDLDSTIEDVVELESEIVEEEP